MSIKRLKKPLVLSIVILALASGVLACFPSVSHSSFNGWTGEASASVGSFYFGIFALWGTVEIVSVLIKSLWGRVLGILAVLIKTAMPWMTFFLMKELGAAAMDMSFSLRIVNPLPYCILALCLGSLVLQGILLFDRRD